MKMEELNDAALEEVTGGMKGYEVIEMRYDIEAGDTFRDGKMYFVVLVGGNELNEDSRLYVQIYDYAEPFGMYKYYRLGTETVKYLAKYEYLGNNVINDSNIMTDP